MPLCKNGSSKVRGNVSALGKVNTISAHLCDYVLPEDYYFLRAVLDSNKTNILSFLNT